MVDAFGVRSSEKEYTVADYMDQSAFDEKFEVDIVHDTIQNIYHIENKYYVPIMSGSFREMYEYAKTYMVHPDETFFHDLMDPDTLVDRLEHSEPSGMIKAECREKLVNGNYRWVQYIGISGVYNGVPEGKIYFYVFDIQNQKDRQSGQNSSVHYVNDRDSLTGLLKTEAFIPAATEKLKNCPGDLCCLAIDIQHFKIFNAWFGYERGDYLLARIGAVLREYEEEEQAVAVYFGRDNFGLLLRHDAQKIQQIFDDIKEIVYFYSNTVGFMPAFGINLVGDTDRINLDVYDRARMAVEEAKKSYTDRIKYYDSGAYDRKKVEYSMLTDFQKALKNQEISFYVQPQVNISTGKIVGAEALARWIKKDGTMISPGTFIPFLEDTGFIIDLDKCVWESVCRWIRKLIDKGIRCVPVSINISQVELLSMDVAAYLYGLTQRYNIPARLLKAEITESAFAENYEVISRAVEQLKEKGFMVLMDDFGSGYSSLNMLDRVNTDVLKLDMAFMQKNLNLSKRGISIIESIISMTKTLGIPVIIEGVENEDQISFLKSLGCNYVQGYYYYRPMSVGAYETMLRDVKRVDFGGIRTGTTEIFHTREFLNENLFTDTMLNNILGPVAFYTQNADGKLNITRFNQQFYDCISDVNMESRQTCIQNYILEEDHSAFYRMLETACSDSVNGGMCTVRFMKSGGGVFWFNMHLFFLRNSGTDKIYYGKIEDVTGMYQQGKAFYEILKRNADSCMRIDLNTRMMYELDQRKPFDDPEARAMDVVTSLRITADAHIEDPVSRIRFVEFFTPERLRRSHEAGIYSESFRTKFLFGGKSVNTRFSAYYIKFVPEQKDNVYVFVNKEWE